MSGLETRSGRTFSPFNLWNAWTAETEYDEPIHTSIDLDSLVRTACDLENARFLANADDAEGVELSSRPPSPLTPPPSEDESEVQEGPSLVATSPTPNTYADSRKAEARIPGPLGSIEKKRKREGASRRRHRKRINRATAGHAPQNYIVDPSLVEALTKDSEPLQLDIDASTLPTSSVGAWIGRRPKGRRNTPWTPEELDELGFTEIVWDGLKTRLVLDAWKRIITVLVGRPQDPEWPMVMDYAAAEVEEVRELGLESGTFDEKYINHRRGNFVALPVGVSFGGGGTKPGNLIHSKPRRHLIQKLLDSPSIKRIAGFQSSAFAAFAPKLYQYLADMLGKLFDQHAGLLHNFTNSIFPAASFNCGLSTVSLGHTDFGNLSHNFCPLTAFGNYDYTKGGHLILFNLKIYVQFPSGSTALIPSACIEHANTLIQEGETWYSIAQYAAGGLFRWVAYGFRSAKSLMKTAAGRKVKDEIDKKEGVRWAEGLAMFSKVGELNDDLRVIFGGSRDS